MMYHSPSVVTLQIPEVPPSKIVAFSNLSRSKQLILISLCISNIVVWLLCTTIQSMILIKFYAPQQSYSQPAINIVHPDYDLACAGIWGSLLFGSSGLLGISAAYERRKTLFVFTLILSIWAIFTSMVIMAFSGLTTVSPELLSTQSDLWLGLECCLLVTAAVAFTINLAVITTICMAICNPCCVPKEQPAQSYAQSNISHSPYSHSMTPQSPYNNTMNPQSPYLPVTPQYPTAQQYGMTLHPPSAPMGHHSSPYSEDPDNNTTPRVMLTKHSIM